MEKNQNKQEFKLSELKPVELAEHPRLREQFIKTLMKIHRVDEAEAESIYDRESLYYKKALTASNKLQSCTNISLYSAFLELAITGLSIQPGSKSEAYLESRGAKQSDGSYLNGALLQVTAYGELNLRIRAGQIIRMSNPIVLYNGDHFQPCTSPRGELTIDYRPAIPRKSATIVGCWVAIHLPHNGIDFKWLLSDDIERLKKYSERGMGGKANALYSANGAQIDPGFLEAKTIKHAMRSYTKLRTGDAVAFEEDIPTPAETDDVFAAPGTTTEQPEPAQADNTVTFNDTEDVF